MLYVVGQYLPRADYLTQMDKVVGLTTILNCLIGLLTRLSAQLIEWFDKETAELVDTRLEKLLAWLTSYEARAPERAPRLYAGYIWDGSEGRRTKPLRDPAQKSYMPVEQWPHDAYPPFASGCGFLIAHQLVDALARRADGLQYCRLFDVPVGIAIAHREERLSIVHLETVRPYRPLPLFREDTIVQHYMQPEEFRQFFDKAYGAPPSAEEQAADARIAAVYDMFVGAKVLRR